MHNLLIAAAGLAEISEADQQQFVRDVFGISLLIKIVWVLAAIFGAVAVAGLLWLAIRRWRSRTSFFEWL